MPAESSLFVSAEIRRSRFSALRALEMSATAEGFSGKFISAKVS
ncbi:MAG: hypothetical protein Q4A07_10035 [Coriobacteriales bacterium]|nr:hypothetical protein [Coriobacteriales bacterium]